MWDWDMILEIPGVKVDVSTTQNWTEHLVLRDAAY